jgi:hypothetical protein
MPRKPKTPTPPKRPSRKIEDKDQFERFIEIARKIGVDENPEALDRAFDKIAPQVKRPD